MKDIIVKKSKINKKGVFVLRDFKKGEAIFKWKPKKLTETEFAKINENEKHYTMKVGKGKYFLMQPPERFVNHSCNPNTKVKNNCDVAIRNIKKGEEITSDYKSGGIVIFKCKCGSKDCKDKVK
jgi:uncharacterized protein